ncbi:hypothetical protein EVAR_13775_1 [Eumeta japonica]|uniref:Uncharacterized protein n=1 Tax=Eumeta variegata TaxID=151549 RepID=A0A4C1U146_EUMVA|nr:hypothetical protein EVAR_13775_1 [Eumeta japonica]
MRELSRNIRRQDKRQSGSSPDTANQDDRDHRANGAFIYTYKMYRRVAYLVVLNRYITTTISTTTMSNTARRVRRRQITALVVDERSKPDSYQSRACASLRLRCIISNTG